MDFVTKSFRKDETLTSWTLLQHICPHFWAWLLNTIAITPKSEDKYVVKVFNWSEFHVSEMTCYKIHTLNIFWKKNWSLKCSDPVVMSVNMALPYLDLNTVSFYCSGSMPTPDRGRSSHLPLEFARHLSMYGHQGARQSHCKSTKRNIFLDKSRNLSPIFSLYIFFRGVKRSTTALLPSLSLGLNKSF